MNILILFSGTKSFSKVLQKNKNNVIRTLDIDSYFDPTYNVDILSWDYKEALKDFKVDYLHSSPVCKYFSKIKHNKCKEYKKLFKKGFELIDKTIEIINWVITEQTPNLKFTIENPKNRITLEYEPLKKYKHIITSYCQYGFLYRKDTTFWYYGFDLELKPRCDNNNICLSKTLTILHKTHKVRIGINNGKKSKFKKNSEDQIGCNEYFKYLRHKVVLGHQPKHDDQIIGWKHFTDLRHEEDYLSSKYKYSDTYFRYRIPSKLIEDIIKCLN
ncbi:MAG: hypothetical protein GY756_17295 [bacterium]|nr:hypothetical protein [bacterium]